MINRREFIKLAVLGTGALAFRPFNGLALPEFPVADRLGRIAMGKMDVFSTFWHNNYGEPSSRGCVNASPEDAKWIFRWSLPQVPYDPGDITVEMPGGTIVSVEDKTLSL